MDDIIFRQERTESVASLLEWSAHDLLFLTHKFFTFFEPIRLVLDVHSKIADLVHDEQFVVGQGPELVQQAVLKNRPF